MREKISSIGQRSTATILTAVTMAVTSSMTLTLSRRGERGKTGVRGKPRGVLHVGQAHTNTRATKTVLSRDARVVVSVLRGETNLRLPCLCMKGNQRQTKRAHCQVFRVAMPCQTCCLDDSLSDVCCLGDDDNSMCTCGAEGRAHKRGCRTLFPRIDVSEGSPVAI